MHGVLVIDKPLGPTSFDVVRQVKTLLGAPTAGHTGTLDPMASGVLAVCLGEAVKLQQFLTGADKVYQATVAFGTATDTQDAAGRVIAHGSPAGLTGALLQAALPRFLGEIDQLPPMYSAVRVQGRRLHEAARAGQEVERIARKVVVHALTLRNFAFADDGRALAVIEVQCGKGTYVRTLAHDLGTALGVPAHLAALRRTQAGPFHIEQAIALDQVGPANADRIIPMAEAVAFLPAARLSQAEAKALGHGQAITPPGTLIEAGLVRALGGSGELLAVCESRGGLLRPLRVMNTPLLGQ
jgi:tRNA pseudouridine55 synthase